MTGGGMTKHKPAPHAQRMVHVPAVAVAVAAVLNNAPPSHGLPTPRAVSFVK